MPRLSHQAKRDLQAKLDTAAGTVNDGHLAWETGQFGAYHIASLTKARDTIAEQLAQFEDREFVLCDSTLNMMRVYEMLATDLLDGVAALTGDKQEELARLPTGEYAVSRRILLNGREFQDARRCTNPAVAIQYLDQWEAEVRSGQLTKPENSAII